MVDAGTVIGAIGAVSGLGALGAAVQASLAHRDIHRASGTTAALRTAFDGVVDEPVPDELNDFLHQLGKDKGQ
jgi:hypothetical protein